MKLLNDYTEALEAIYDYFGFVEDWTVFPIDIRDEYYWKITAIEVTFYDSLKAYETDDGMHSYSNEIYYHRHYPKAIYVGKDYTLIMVDTHTDGNKFLAIFDNNKEIK